MLDIAMSEVGLQRPRVVPLVCQRVAAGVPEHVRVRLERQLHLRARALMRANSAVLNGAPRPCRNPGRHPEYEVAGLL